MQYWSLTRTPFPSNSYTYAFITETFAGDIPDDFLSKVRILRYAEAMKYIISLTQETKFSLKTQIKKYDQLLIFLKFINKNDIIFIPDFNSKTFAAYKVQGEADVNTGIYRDKLENLKLIDGSTITVLKNYLQIGNSKKNQEGKALPINFVIPIKKISYDIDSLAYKFNELSQDGLNKISNMTTIKKLTLLVEKYKFEINF
ncbi:MAG: hypothetical protein IJU40_01580 [Desulfovibrionaceae bacterium]|nr:hypothetical protein [Desulfovibrionaceae bacterium]